MAVRRPQDSPGPQAPTLDRHPVLDETPFYQRVQKPGLRIRLQANGRERLPPRTPPLEETFVRVPFPLARLQAPAKCLHEVSYQWHIDLPVARDAEGFYYAYGWVLPTLAASGAEGLHNIATILRDWSTHARAVQQMLGRTLDVMDLLVVHPHTRRSTWRVMLQSQVFRDTQMVGLFKSRGLLRVADAARLAAVPGLLDQVLVDQRPYLADFLWRHGARAVSAAGLFHVAVPNAYLYAINLGTPSAPFGNSQLQRVAARGQFAGLSVAQAILRAGATWRTRFHEVLGSSPVPRFEVERHEENRVHRESWSLPAWLVHHANLADLPGGVLPHYAFTPDIQDALLEDRLAWLHWALDHGCAPATTPLPLSRGVQASVLPVSMRTGDAVHAKALDATARLEAAIREHALAAPAAPVTRARRRA